MLLRREKCSGLREIQPGLGLPVICLVTVIDRAWICSELHLQQLCSPFVLHGQLLAFCKKIGRAVSYPPKKELPFSFVVLVYVTGLRIVQFGVNWMRRLPKLDLAAGQVFGSPWNFCLPIIFNGLDSLFHPSIIYNRPRSQPFRGPFLESPGNFSGPKSQF